MNIQIKTTSLQSYQIILYNRALHPELFDLKARRVFERDQMELEAWVMPGRHLLRFEHHNLCACELICPLERTLPETGIVATCLCAGERDYEHLFEHHEVRYLTTVQTETLSDNLYLMTYREMLEHAQEEPGTVLYEWVDEAGKCMSLLDVQTYKGEIHAQSYHMQASSGVVLRTQSIFELTSESSGTSRISASSSSLE